MPPVYSIFIRFQPKRRKINPKEPPKTLSQEKSWNRVFLMEKREEKPKRNLKKGLTKPKTRHQSSVKKRKRDLKSEQKKRRGAERLSEKRIKKDSLLQPDYLDILWIKPSRFWQMKLRKKCQKRVRKDTTYFYVSLFGTFFAISFDILRCRNVTGNPWRDDAEQGKRKKKTKRENQKNQ